MTLPLAENHDRIIEMNISLKSKIIALVVGIGLILIGIFNFGLGGMSAPAINSPKPVDQNSSTPSLVSSDPPQLFQKQALIVPPNQVIKLNFNVPFLNGPETKIKMNPEHEIQVDVENDNKTIVIKPKTPYKLGQGYTIFISSEAKLRDEGKVLGQSYDLLFNVINYSGI